MHPVFRFLKNERRGIQAPGGAFKRSGPHHPLSVERLEPRTMLSAGPSSILNAAVADAAHGVPATHATQGQTLADLPAAAQSAISAAIGQDQSAYHASIDAAGVTLANAVNSFTAQFQSGTLHVSAGPDTWDMSLLGLGYGAAVQPVGTAQITANANRVDCSYGTIDEWYINGPGGLEQGFTVAPLAQTQAGGSLTVDLALGGNLAATVNAAGDGLTLARPDGSAALGYTGLMACDATGKSLPASLEVVADGGHQELLIHVNTAGAEGAITIDPFVQQAKLTASDGKADMNFGGAVAIAGDTVVVSANDGPLGGNGGPGAVYVFTKPVSGWADMTQVAKLTPSDGAAGERFGSSVAISGDTVVVGADEANLGSNSYHIQQGAAYVFTMPVTGWADMTQTAKLIASDYTDAAEFGTSVAISGNTIVVGAQQAMVGANEGQGAAYVFAMPNTGWADATQTAKLSASDGAARNGGWEEYFGHAVAISGGTVVVGAYGDIIGGNDNQGAAYVFTEPVSGRADMTQTAKLTASDGAKYNDFGSAVSISGDTVVVGAYGAKVGNNSYQGAAYVFVAPVSGWADMTQTAKLTASDGAGYAQFGNAVSISGNMVVIGAYDATVGAIDNEGAAYVFAEPGSGWANMTQTAKLTATDGDGNTQFGFSVSISGSTVVVGANSAYVAGHSRQGAAYVFGTAAASITVTPPIDQTAISGQSKSFALGSFTQSNASAPFSVDVNWGDGSADTSFNQTSTGTLTVQTHTFAATASDTVSVTLTDAYGQTSNTATFTVTVASDQAPTVSNFSKSLNSNATLTFAASDFTAAFGDPDSGDTLQKIQIINLPSPGTLKLNNVAVTQNQEIPVGQLGALTYTPASGVSSDSFNWKGSDGDVYATNAATVNLTIHDINAVHLAITQQPISPLVAKTLTPGFKVAVENLLGTIQTSSGGKITVTIASGPGGGLLKGTTTASISKGIASFTNLSLTVAGDYTLQFADSLLSGSAPLTFGLTVAKGVTTIPAPKVASAGYTYDKTISLSTTLKSTAPGLVPFTGTATLVDNGTVLATATLTTAGVAKFTLTTVPGTYSCTIQYAGDTNHTPFTSSAFTLLVNQAPTTTALAASFSSLVFGQPLTLTATVKSSTAPAIARTGTVSFYDGLTLLGTASLDGSSIASLTLTPATVGKHTFKAVYAGDSNFKSSTSPGLARAVNKDKTSILLVPTAASPLAVNHTFSLNVTVATIAPGVSTLTGNQVTIKDHGKVLTTLSLDSGGTASLPGLSYTAAGTHSLTAIYAGDADTLGVTSLTLKLTIV